ncbi:MAG: YbaK/EbsC family protein [Armatimonadetes bacterium]|nr:YbaK/EbsC family protein [Armatimonadota bacterium]
MKCRERLEAYLREQQVPFSLSWHPEAYTAQEVAAAAHIPGRLVAKVVMVAADSRLTMAVLPADLRVDVPKLASALGAKEVRLAREEEFSHAFPDCDVGAMPPFGNLYQIPVIVEEALTRDPEIAFEVGTHREMMRVRYPDFHRLVQPKVAAFATPKKPVGA